MKCKQKIEWKMWTEPQGSRDWNKRFSIHATGVPVKGKKKKKEVMSKFPKFGKNYKPVDSVSIMNPIHSRQINPPDNTPLSSFLEIKTNQKVQKLQEKWYFTYKRKPRWITVGVSSETIEARKKVTQYVSTIEKKNSKSEFISQELQRNQNIFGWM